jgi:hypothetical protein
MTLDPREVTPGAPKLVVEYAADGDSYRVRHTPTGGWVEVPGDAVRERLRRAGVAATWPLERRAAIAVARSFVQRTAAADALARRLRDSEPTDSR